MAVTLKDIAERTGVSPSVVSTVLSGRDNGTFVSESTRQKVLQVAEMLNYTPVRSGRPRGSRRLRRQRTEQFIGIWDPEYSSSTAYYIQNLQAALRSHAIELEAELEDDFGLRLLTADDLPRLDAIGIMGIILLGSVLLPREAATATIPCIIIGEVDNPPREVVQVHLDNFDAGRQIAQYLWTLGHRRIAFLAPGAQARVTRNRYQGMQSVWIKHQGNPAHVLPAQYDLHQDLSEREQVRQTVQALLGSEAAKGDRPTALVCYDENIAAIVAQTLYELNIRVPNDLSLAGFFDTPRLGEALIPSLTTIRQPAAKQAEVAIEQLYLMHETEDMDIAEQRDISLPGELIVRGSCAAPPAL